MLRGLIMLDMRSFEPRLPEAMFVLHEMIRLSRQISHDW